MNLQPKWKNFERIVAAIHHAVNQGGIVKWNDRINGRQFDVTIKFKEGFYNFLTVIECKDYKDSVPVEKVEAFVTKAAGVNANKAIFVTSSRFQKGCREVATRHNIGLYSLKEINDLPKDILGDQLMPAINISDIALGSEDGEVYIFPNYGGKLQYLLNHTQISIKGSNFIIGRFISNWVRNKKHEINEGAEDFIINMVDSATATIPQEDALVIFNSVKFKCKFVEVISITKPTFDPYLLQKINSKYLYKDEITGESHKLKSNDLQLGFDNVFEVGKFYFNPRYEFFYYCDKIVDNIATIILVESYQHGNLIQCSFQANTKHSKHYVEVTDNNEIKRLKKLLLKMKSK